MACLADAAPLCRRPKGETLNPVPNFVRSFTDATLGWNPFGLSAVADYMECSMLGSGCKLVNRLLLVSPLCDIGLLPLWLRQLLFCGRGEDKTQSVKLMIHPNQEASLHNAVTVTSRMRA
eukprot:3205257-Amphidinium_carterae.1